MLSKILITCLIALCFSAPTQNENLSIVQLMDEPVSSWKAMSKDFPLKYGLISSDRAMTYFEANTLCKIHGADGLAEIFSKDQQDFIEKNLGEMKKMMMQNENLQEKIH